MTLPAHITRADLFGVGLAIAAAWLTGFLTGRRKRL